MGMGAVIGVLCGGRVAEAVTTGVPEGGVVVVAGADGVARSSDGGVGCDTDGVGDVGSSFVTRGKYTVAPISRAMVSIITTPLMTIVWVDWLERIAFPVTKFRSLYL
jgi:hypothetical protein